MRLNRAQILAAFVLALLVMLAALGCTELNKQWVEQDRDHFYELDDAGLDRWIANSALSPERISALQAMTRARRVRVQKGCESVGLPIYPVGVTSTAGR